MQRTPAESGKVLYQLIAGWYDRTMLTCIFEDGGKGLLRHVVADTIVLKDDKILLVKRTATLLEGGKWGLVGGYMDRDETVAQTAAREVMEETGYQIKDLNLLAIVDRPDRPNEDRQNVAFLYFCTATDKVGEPDWESDEQKWFAWDELPPTEQLAFDHADHIKLYLKYIKKPFQIPIFSNE